MRLSEVSKEIQYTLATKEGKEFEDFVVRVYKIAYDTDFVPIKPSGSDGDLANDGYIADTLLIQIYAPEKINQKKIIDKLQHDFERAVKFWSIKEWHFVINDKYKGIPTRVRQTVDAMNSESPVLLKTINAQDIENFIVDLLKTKPIHVFVLLNFDKNIEDFDDFEKLSSVMDFLSRLEDVRKEDFEFYSFQDKKFYQGKNEKVEINITNEEFKKQFSHIVVVSRKVIKRYKEKIGEEQIDAVGEYIKNTYDAYVQSMSEEEALIETFNDIYSKMSNDHNIKAALWVMIGYFFDICDIGKIPNGNGE